jgi:hypothetical protein
MVQVSQRWTEGRKRTSSKTQSEDLCRTKALNICNTTKWRGCSERVVYSSARFFAGTVLYLCCEKQVEWRCGWRSRDDSTQRKNQVVSVFDQSPSQSPLEPVCRAQHTNNHQICLDGLSFVVSWKATGAEYNVCSSLFYLSFTSGENRTAVHSIFFFLQLI